MSTIEFQHDLVGFRQQLFWFALSLTKDRDSALDLTQESMLRALTHSDQFRERTNMKAWLLAIARNTFINGHRRGKRTERIMTHVDRERTRAVRVETPSTPESTIRMREIQRAMGALEDIFREPFRMHHEGFKYQEIADELRIPIGTVKSRIHQARNRLACLLTDHNGTALA